MPVKQVDKNNILYSCYSQKTSEGEQFIANHVFSYLLAGSQQMSIGNQTFLYKEGDYRFFRKNQLCRYVKHPPAGGEFKSISVFMDQDTLQSMSAEHNLHMEKPYTGNGALLLQPSSILKNYVESLTPYMGGEGEMNKVISNLKVKEAIMLLLQTLPTLKDALFDFSEPGKIDLEAYMNEHYKYNVSLDRFAYLTGRSLATFKRDFERIYNTTPNRWLQQKRLNDAYYLIKEKGLKVSDVYMDVGFKDFSHFSFAFKKAFGVAPSMLKV